MLNPEQALPRRSQPLPHHQQHAISGLPLPPLIPEHYATPHSAMGCFRGVLRLSWQQPGVSHTSDGHIGRHTLNPPYLQASTAPSVLPRPLPHI
ncbi:peptide-methionine (S)-S-oxide reductase, partial [Plesiomonas shigelloides]|nr:peptide-methionine (S)-S-oxide reductase [Plesiomonas shigelloides]